MEFKGTPGPWQVGVGNSGVWTPEGEKVASCISFGHSQEESEKNANLIAAAPDLLEALQVLVNAQFADEGRYAITMAQSAIAKALGENNV